MQYACQRVSFDLTVTRQRSDNKYIIYCVSSLCYISNSRHCLLYPGLGLVRGDGDAGLVPAGGGVLAAVLGVALLAAGGPPALLHLHHLRTLVELDPAPGRG